jgi:hypothetical protein
MIIPDDRFAKRIFAACVAVSLLQLLWLRWSLPATVASHFDLSGNADGWMQRDTFLIIMGGVDLMVALVFAVTGPLIRLLPDSMINLPHREYWLAPERREGTFSRFAAWMYHMGSLTMLFMTVMTVDVGLRNTSGGSGLGGLFWLVFAAYLLTLVLLIVMMMRSFRVPRGGTREGGPLD